MAIPVADAEQEKVSRLFQQVLEKALTLADRFAGHPPLPLHELVDCVPGHLSSNREGGALRNGQCFIYPEVSAGVQGFVRSQVSEPGTYLFSDTGAGTVDQSVFIFSRIPSEPDQLTYLHASVLPLGSSQIERRTAQEENDMSCENLERLRSLKELGQRDDEFRVARNKMGQQLLAATVETAYKAKKKLHLQQQFNEIRLLFGGGGHVKDPFETSILRAFRDNRLVAKPLNPDILGMPLPTDLDPVKHIGQPQRH
jgi:hypothetical protein